jgi:DNA-binding CsgD family transcriptional regulator
VSNPAVRWPHLQEFETAIIYAEGNFKDERLRGLRVQRHMTFQHNALSRRGTYGTVFKIEGNGVAYALKVFKRPQQDRQLRYRLIDQHLRSIPQPDRLVSFAYDEEGIRVGDRDYPTLRMDWAQGDSLESYLGQCFANSVPVDNEKLLGEWVTTLRELHDAVIAHGDLQHNNVLVQSDGTFRLVDYDGFFVPAMRQHHLGACEAGVASYQHPGRASGPGRFNERMDDFSALVIALTLACVDADLWDRYHEDDRLLVDVGDLLRPGQSDLFTELSGRNGTIGRLANLLRTAAEHDLDQVPGFGHVVSELGLGRAERPAGPERAASQRPVAGGWPATWSRPPDAAGPPAMAPGGGQPPSYAQRQIAALHAAGRSADQIASALGLTRATVEAYIKSLDRAREAAGWPAPLARTPPAVTPPAVTASPPEQRRELTPRQQEVLSLLQAGLSPAQIAARLGLQPTTVNRHLSSIRALADESVRRLIDQAGARAAAVPEDPGQPAVPRAASPRAITTPRWWESAAAAGSQPRPPATPGPAAPPQPVKSSPQVTPALPLKPSGLVIPPKVKPAPQVKPALQAKPPPKVKPAPLVKPAALVTPGPAQTAPAPKKASVGSSIATVLGVIFLILIILGVLGAIFS